MLRQWTSAGSLGNSAGGRAANLIPPGRPAGDLLWRRWAGFEVFDVEPLHNGDPCCVLKRRQVEDAAKRIRRDVLAFSVEVTVVWRDWRKDDDMWQRVRRLLEQEG